MIKYMKLSLYTDNALKVLLYCASHTNQRITRKQITEYFDLSDEHLRKVIHHLSQMQFIHTYAGRNGGFELARPASKINIGDVIKQTENQTSMFNCSGQQCRLLSCCSLSQILMEAQQQFFNSLSRHSLADLIADKKTFKLLIKKH